MENIKCTCGNTDVVKAGKRLTRAGVKQRYQCKKCGRMLLGEAKAE